MIKKSLTDNEVKAVKYLINLDILTNIEIGKAFGVSKDYISNIKTGRRRSTMRVPI